MVVGRRMGRVMPAVALLLVVGCSPAADEPADESGNDEPPATDGPAEDPTQEEAPAARWVSPDGDDDADGSSERPWATLEHAFAQLEPGDTLTVAGGTYRERIRDPDLRTGRPDAPIRVVADGSEPAVLEGLLWLRDLDHWSLEGLNVTWDEERNDSSEHMVKLSGGEGWQLVDAEISGARSFAGILIAESPSDWRLADLCVHSTHETNGTNQDHLIYVNSKADAGPGVIERSLLFDAPNGSGVKLGGPREYSEGTHRTTVRDNTIVETAQPILIAWESSNNVLEGNLLGDAGDNYATIRGYRLEGEGNVARGNAGYGATGLLLNDEGYRGIEEGDGNRYPVEPDFDRRDRCDGYVPQDEEARDYGHVAER